MNHARNYRLNSSAWTGRAPRSTGERWPADPVSAPRGFWHWLLLLICGH